MEFENFSSAHDEQAIVALSSGELPSPIAVLRFSGNKCHDLFLPSISYGGMDKKPQYNKLFLCKFVAGPQKKILDEPMVVFYKGPHSYTGQDSVELFLHGGPYLVQQALQHFYQQGFRPAEPGEFTRRAYIGGKLDLSQAEGIRDLIHAQSEQQWLAARQLADGSLRKKIDKLRNKVLEAMAWLEARIDFPDEKETSGVEMQEVDKRVDAVAEAISALSDRYDSGRIAASGLKVALFGKPNVGKSSLLNHLLGTNRALVTPHAGTTRDYLEEACLIKGRLFRFIDTAGVRESSCQVEQLGIERSREIAESADIVLFLLAADSNASSLKEYESLAKKFTAKTIAILSKSDLAKPDWWAEIPEPKFAISLIGGEGKGLEDLKQALVSSLDTLLRPLAKEQSFISNSRHKHALECACAGLERFYQGRKEGAYEEMLAFELLGVAKDLGGIIGKLDADEVLSAVFSSFCVGK